MITVRFLYYNWFGIIPDDYTEGNKNMIPVSYTHLTLPTKA